MVWSISIKHATGAFSPAMKDNKVPTGVFAVCVLGSDYTVLGWDECVIHLDDGNIYTTDHSGPSCSSKPYPPGSTICFVQE